LSLNQYDSDKITNRYLEWYDPIFEPWVDKKITLLEIGVYKGGSLLLWRDYFPSGTIVGIDIKLPENFEPTDRIRLFEGGQADLPFLSRVANEVAPDGFDIIIDDASHFGELTKTAFWHLFDHHLKPNGLYVIEDWGTGYWDDWPDGKSLDLESYLSPRPRRRLSWLKIAEKLRPKAPLRCHSYGMVGFIKQLVDEQGAHAVTRRQLKGKSTRGSKFENMLITPSIVFIRKAGHQLFGTGPSDVGDL
jgi:SAM-dependent methyltransferase